MREANEHQLEALAIALASCRRRARTEAPIFLISLGIGSERLEIGPDHCGDSSSLSFARNFAGRGLALAERLLETLDRDRKPHFAAVSEAIGDGLGHAEDFYWNPFDHMRFDTFSEKAFSRLLKNGSDA